MTILDLAQRYVTLRRSGSRYEGPCPKCGGSARSDKFSVYPAKDDCHCFSCGLHGDAITLLREMEGLSCPDAHEQLGRGCDKRNCPMWDKCRLGARANGEQPRKTRQRESLQPPMPEEPRAFEPAEADTPEQLWMKQAAALVEKAHANLLEDQEQIDYLTRRGIPLEAIKKGQLGYLPEDRFPSRESWGQPTILKDNGKKKKLLIPAGILIPFFDADGHPHRIRIRRNNPPQGAGRYYWVPGSGNDVPVIGGSDRRGVVVVESDLDAFMVRWQCRDLDVAVIPLGTCNAKPKGWAMQVLEKALAILVAHDFEPRFNAEKGVNENPGGQGSRWWTSTFRRAKRWPVPAEKDPGEFFESGGDIRQWVIDGLPPVFHVQAPQSQPNKQQSAADYLPEHAKGQTINGHAYVVAYHHSHVQLLQRHYQDAEVFSPSDMAALKGMGQEEAEKMLLARKVFDGDIDETLNPISKRTAAWLDDVENIQQQEDVPLPDEPEYVQEELL